MALKDAAAQNRPAAAGGLAGAVAALLVALSEWGLEALEAIITVPGNVQAAFLALMVVVSGMIGGLIGKLAQRKTWAEDTHKAAVAYALQLNPVQWGEAIESLGMTREEALETIGIDPAEVP